MKKNDPTLPSGFYDVFIGGKLRKVYCDTDEDGGILSFIQSFMFFSHYPDLVQRGTIVTDQGRDKEALVKALKRFDVC